jgi:hypothetical protein
MRRWVLRGNPGGVAAFFDAGKESSGAMSALVDVSTSKAIPLIISGQQEP